VGEQRMPSLKKNKIEKEQKENHLLGQWMRENVWFKDNPRVSQWHPI
jgi:hypothetical protein